MIALVRLYRSALLLLPLAVLAALPARAQETVWLQIEARPSLASAEDRARDYAGRLDNVAGFRLRSGWYAIALGPFEPDTAAQELRLLRGSRTIPGDSFVTDGTSFTDRFWPVGAGGVATALPSAPTTIEETAVRPDPIPSGETVEEARRSERTLQRPDREELQRALQLLGFYEGRIDGAIGPGTRRAMAAWQEAQGYEATGVMTTKQRAELLGGIRDAIASLGLSTVVDRTVGIEIEIPSNFVSFEGYEAPFARFTGDEATVLLISQSGDEATLQGLYDVMQTLEIVPLEGPRDIGRRGFTLTGANDRIVSYTSATLEGGAVKGFTVVWPAGDELRRKLLLDRMQASFRPIEGVVMPDTAGGEALQRPDLLAGLQIRQPEASVSGFFVDGQGAVLTTSAAVAGCGRITVGDEVDADVAAIDETLGLALLRPRSRLAPLAVGRFNASNPRLQSEIAVSGYSYGGLLGAPTMTFGTLEDVRGLNGEEALKRLALNVEPGDAGGPVLDTGGSVVGMLLPRVGDTDRSLPAEVQFATDAEAIAGFLAGQGIDLASGTGSGALAPEDLAILGADMTVLVECWN